MLIPTSLVPLDEVLTLPKADLTYEYLDGKAIPKPSPNFRHSRSQKKLLFLLEAWGAAQGFVQSEWGVRLQPLP
ncbi:Uma2 family endonuclease [Phormidium yuhuli]|uniref:Uma2 family endonuclease n=1 Tax=Phormidium yuhuli TaxID=2974039 RepID=UPI0035A8F7BF